MQSSFRMNRFFYIFFYFKTSFYAPISTIVSEVQQWVVLYSTERWSTAVANTSSCGDVHWTVAVVSQRVCDHRCLCTASCDLLFQSRRFNMNTVSDETLHCIDCYYFPKSVRLKYAEKNVKNCILISFHYCTHVNLVQSRIKLTRHLASKRPTWSINQSIFIY